MSVGYRFDEKQHVHTFDGKRMYGVTSVLKNWGDPSALVNWAANQACDYILAESKTDLSAIGFTTEWVNKVVEEARTAHTRKRDKAGDRGTEIHAQLEVAMNQWIQGDYSVSDSQSEIVVKVLDWIINNGIKPLKSEMPVYSLNHFYAGIADGVIEKEGKKYILDFKTSGSIQTKAFIQCGAYSVAVKEMKPGAEIAGVVIVHIPKGASFNPEKNVYWFYDIENLEQSWLSILTAFKTDQALQKLIKY